MSECIFAIHNTVNYLMYILFYNDLDLDASVWMEPFIKYVNDVLRFCQ